MTTYETRVVAFIDILGFKGLLDETTDNKGKDNSDAIDRLINLSNLVRSAWDMDAPEDENFNITGSKQVTVFSDSIAVSFKYEDRDQLFYTLREVQDLVVRLIENGILCRGGIALGKLIHNKRMIFGPALVEAYTLETKCSNYPRIVIDRSVIDVASVNVGTFIRPLIQGIVDTDHDGLLFIDYFTRAAGALLDPARDFVDYSDKLGAIIRRGLQGSTHPSAVDRRIKYYWMREKYNKMATDYNSRNPDAQIKLISPERSRA